MLWNLLTMCRFKKKKKQLYMAFMFAKLLICGRLFYLGFLLQPLTNHATVGEGGGYFLTTTSTGFTDISRVITVDCSNR